MFLNFWINAILHFSSEKFFKEVCCLLEVLFTELIFDFCGHFSLIIHFLTFLCLETLMCWTSRHFLLFDPVYAFVNSRAVSIWLLRLTRYLTVLSLHVFAQFFDDAEWFRRTDAKVKTLTRCQLLAWLSGLRLNDFRNFVLLDWSLFPLFCAHRVDLNQFLILVHSSWKRTCCRKRAENLN